MLWSLTVQRPAYTLSPHRSSRAAALIVSDSHPGDVLAVCFRCCASQTSLYLDAFTLSSCVTSFPCPKCCSVGMFCRCNAKIMLIFGSQCLSVCLLLCLVFHSRCLLSNHFSSSLISAESAEDSWSHPSSSSPPKPKTILPSDWREAWTSTASRLLLMESQQCHRAYSYTTGKTLCKHALKINIYSLRTSNNVFDSSK